MIMHVCVAIVGFRNTTDIVECLKALDRSDHNQFEVVICENGGLAAYKALISVIPAHRARGQAVRIIQAPGNVGYAGGVNLCIKASPNADAWWILNPDTEPYPHAMDKMVRRLAAGDVDAVGGTVFLSNGKVQSHGGHWQGWLARAVSIGHSSDANLRPAPVEIEKRQNYLNGASMMIGRQFLATAGPMREDYFLYCEEVEWCLRGIKLGLRLGFEPDAFVLHHGGTTTGNDQELRNRSRVSTFLGERNRMLLTRDCFPSRLPIVALTGFAVIFAKYARRGAWRQLLYAISGWWAGLHNNRGAPGWLSR
jgi:N-acetylglucosaminyl-diphospho-decaprenol L-rhamnosyltransferase